jgi:predicted DNA-binding transcriptional regulator AlpA
MESEVAVKKLLSPQEVSELIGLSVETLAQWRSQGRGIPYIKISRNCVRYRQGDLDSWIAHRIVPVLQGSPEPGGRI